MPWLHALPFDAPPIESNDAFTDYLLKDVIPFCREPLPRRRRPRAPRAVRFVAGRRGRAHDRPEPTSELFASQIAAYSTGGPLPELGEAPRARARKHPERLNAQLRLLWLGCRQRRRAPSRRMEALAKLLADHGVKATFNPTDGGVHNWTLWREYLHETVVKLFQPGA